MIVWILQSAATILLGLGICACLRRRSAAVRNLIARSTLIAAWLLPVGTWLSVWSPAWHPLARPGQFAVQTVEWPRAALASTLTHPPSTSAESTSVDLWPVLYAAISVALLIRWAIGLLRIRALVKGGENAGAGVIYVRGLGVPATFGTFSPAILLPANAVEWPETRRQAAVLHEQAHIRRGDWSWQAISALFAAVQWANPAAWLLHRVLRATAETAADDEVLETMRPSEYARELLAVAAAAPKLSMAMAMGREGQIHGRVVAILGVARDRRRPNRATAGLMGAAALIAGVSITALSQAEETIAADSDLKIVRAEVREATGEKLPFANFKPSFPGQKWFQLTLRVEGCPSDRPCEAKTVDPDHSVIRNASPKMIDAKTQEFQFYWPARGGSEMDPVRVAVASGSWRPYSGPLNYRIGSSPSQNRQVPSVAFAVPRSLGGKNVRISAIDAKGKVLASSIANFSDPVEKTPYYVSTNLAFPSLAPGNLRKVKIETRDFKAMTVNVSRAK